MYEEYIERKINEVLLKKTMHTLIGICFYVSKRGACIVLTFLYNLRVVFVFVNIVVVRLVE